LENKTFVVRHTEIAHEQKQHHEMRAVARFPAIPNVLI